MSTFYENVKVRRSVRTFDGEALSDVQMQALKSFTKETGNPYNLPVTFTFLSPDNKELTSPVLAGVPCYVTAKITKAAHAEEAYGYSFEKFLMFAQDMGLGSVWIGGTMNRAGFEKASNLAEGEIMPCMSPLGVPAKKMSLKEGLMRKGVKADSRIDFSELFYQADFQTPYTEEEANLVGLYQALHAVQLAPSAVNKQPWRCVLRDNMVHFYEKHTKGFMSETTGDLQKIDMGIALYHFEEQAKADGLSPVFTIADPGLALPTDTEYIASYGLTIS